MTSTATSLDLYIQSAEAQAVIPVCVAADPIYANTKEQLEAWLSKHSATLKDGENQAKAQGMLNAGAANIKTFAAAKAQMLTQLPADDQRRRCDEVVVRLKDEVKR